MRWGGTGGGRAYENPVGWSSMCGSPIETVEYRW